MITEERINQSDLRPPFVKAAVDIEKEIVSIGGELHIDCAEELIENGSRRPDIWGINIYPDGRIDFISLINIRPQDNNRGMEIKDDVVREKILGIVGKFLRQ